MKKKADPPLKRWKPNAKVFVSPLLYEPTGCGKELVSARIIMRIRRDCGLSQSKLAQVLDCHESSIRNWERGIMIPIDHHKKLIRELAFYNQLPYAAEVFPEMDDPWSNQCPMCQQLEDYRRKMSNRDEERRRPKATMGILED